MDDETLIAHYIDHDTARPSSDARLRHSGLPVWVLIRDLKVARGNVLQVAADYDLPRDAVVAARTYYLRHAVQIDARIAAERTIRRAAPQAA